MQDFFSSIFRFFLTPWGIFGLSALDSSMFFFLPAAIDTAVIIMAARYTNWFWVFPLLATAGSIAGASATYIVGRKVGKPGLERWVSKKRLERIQKKLEKREVFTIGLAALLPPPFPLTPFILTSGALGMDKKKFFASLGAMRFARFTVEAGLAVIYGRSILEWFKSDSFEYVIGTLVFLAIAGSAVSIFLVVKKVR